MQVGIIVSHSDIKCEHILEKVVIMAIEANTLERFSLFKLSKKSFLCYFSLFLTQIWIFRNVNTDVPFRLQVKPVLIFILVVFA
jgi:hypothetical protein